MLCPPPNLVLWLLLLRQAPQDECEGELAVAMLLLESALAALNMLTKADITAAATTLQQSTNVAPAFKSCSAVAAA
jgi:hypothetical protein